MDFGTFNAPIDLVLAEVLTHDKTPTRMIILAEVLWTTWLEKNSKVYRGQLNRTPLLVKLWKFSLKVD
jgi:hypothetical protein